jgi:hypothetical protein
VELFSHRAPSFGDGSTTAVLAQSVNDASRAAAGAQALVRLVVADPEHGAANAALISDWVTSWRERCVGAARALLGAFADCGVDNQGAAEALTRVTAFHDTLIAECGLPT